MLDLPRSDLREKVFVDHESSITLEAKKTDPKVGLFYFIVGMMNSAPDRMPVGQRAVMVFIRV